MLKNILKLNGIQKLTIKQLKEAERAIILLYLDDKSYKEIAEILGLTVTNVGAKVNRIKTKLKNMMNHG